jgi:hypothetical protein
MLAVCVPAGRLLVVGSEQGRGDGYRKMPGCWPNDHAELERYGGDATRAVVDRCRVKISIDVSAVDH